MEYLKPYFEFAGDSQTLDCVEDCIIRPLRDQRAGLLMSLRKTPVRVRKASLCVVRQWRADARNELRWAQERLERLRKEAK